MKQVAFAVPGDLDTPTGGYAYDRRIVSELRALGWRVEVIDLGNSFPAPDKDARHRALDRLLATPAGVPIVVDGLAFGVLAEEARRLCERNPLVALVHHPLAFETGIDRATQRDLHDSEQAALACARAVVVTSAPTAALLVRDYAVAASCIAVVPPGIDAAPSRARTRDGKVALLSVGSIVPRKAYGVLIDALGGLSGLPWRLTIAGDLSRNEQEVARVNAAIMRLGLHDRVVLAGAVSPERLAELYGEADLFVMASLFEGYGMVFGEALAHGLPLVVTAVGAAKDIVPAEAGRFVAPGDAAALREALRDVLENAKARAKMAQAARAAAARLPGWRQSAMQFAQVLEPMT